MQLFLVTLILKRYYHIWFFSVTTQSSHLIVTQPTPPMASPSVHITHNDNTTARPITLYVSSTTHIPDISPDVTPLRND